MVTLDDNQLSGTTGGSDPIFDVAVLRIAHPQRGAPTAVGRSDRVRIGDEVLAIGNPRAGSECTRGFIGDESILPETPFRLRSRSFRPMPR